MMTAHGMDELRWAYKLAPHLTGWVQQAYDPLPAAQTGAVSGVKEQCTIWGGMKTTGNGSGGLPQRG